MAEGRGASFNEKQLALYLDEYYELADLIFRFGTLLTLSREGGERIVEETYKLLIEDFPNIKANSKPTVVLMTFAWSAWKKIGNEKFHEVNTPIIQSMKRLAVNQRAILFAVELAGLNLREVSKAFGLADEKSVRHDLADANQFLALNEIRT
jgi:DNA-directed RNA polymerase specialized sigma24 family protein